MPDNGNKTRPVRTLTVKNFSVIKEAKLEFGKITVLIGPQASGKSLLCKLALFFGQVVPELCYRWFDRPLAYEEVAHGIEEEFIEGFPQDSWSGQRFQICYDTGQFQIQLKNSSPENRLVLKFPAGFRGLHKSRHDLRSTPPLPISDDVYIPAGRAFFSIPSRKLAAPATKNLDWVTRRYAAEYEDQFKALLKCYQSDLEMLREFASLATEILKGHVVREDERILFESTEDSRRRPFEILSSGTLELLPLINSLSQLIDQPAFPHLPTGVIAPLGILYVEEPELSVFPSTQSDLVRILAWLSNTSGLGTSYAITTHSPYILSAFNNLILAGQLGKDKRLKKKIKIDERFWIEPGTFKAYSIRDGKLESILSDTGLIDGDYLDSVSETIGNEFDELLRLEYGKKKAS